MTEAGFEPAQDVILHYYQGGTKKT